MPRTPRLRTWSCRPRGHIAFLCLLAVQAASAAPAEEPKGIVMIQEYMAGPAQVAKPLASPSAPSSPSAPAAPQVYAPCETPEELARPRRHLSCKLAMAIEYEYQLYKQCVAQAKMFKVIAGRLQPRAGLHGLDLTITETDIDHDNLILRIKDRLSSLSLRVLPGSKSAPYAMRVDLSPAWTQSAQAVHASPALCARAGY